MIPILLLFSPLHVYAAVKSAAGGESVAVSTETVTEVSTEVTTEEKKATPGDAWYSSITGVRDDQPKTLDDVYLVLFWILLVLVVYVLVKAFIWILNSLG